MSAGKPPSRDWRAQPPVQSAYAREWRGFGGQHGSRYSRKFKLRMVVLGLVVLLGLFVVMLAPTTGGVPKVQIVTFGIGAYGGRANPQGNMPINPFGEQDAKAFQILNDQFPSQFLPVRQEDNVLNGAQLLSFLQIEASADNVANQNLIIFCTMHGLVQPSGEVELFAIDATPDSPSNSPATMVPVKELIAKLQQSRARRVLLILDAARLDSNWRLGILNNDIAAQLASDWPARKLTSGGSGSTDAGKVSLLLAAGPGQHSWPATDRSTFVQSVIEGLSGVADGWEAGQPPRQSGSRDRRVSLLELAAFAHQRVDDWAHKHYGAIQTVKLLGNVTDFDLAVVSTGNLSELIANTKVASKPPALNAAAAKGAATKAAQAGAKEGEQGDSKTETAPASKPDAATDAADAKKDTAAKPAAGADTNWATRLDELLKVRDEWGELGRRGRNAVCRQMPLTWRTFESKLALAAALNRGGMEELSQLAIQQADVAYKKLRSQTDFISGELHASDAQRRTMQELGFGPEVTPSPEAIAATNKTLLSLLKEAIPATAPPAATAPSPPPAELDPLVVQFWLRLELRRDTDPENWDRLKQIVQALDRTGQTPTTPEGQFVRELLLSENAAERFGRGDIVQRIMTLRDRCRRLAVRSPESLPLIRDSIQSALRYLIAAERWLLASDASRAEVRDWLEKAEDAAVQAESTTRRYVDTIGVWSDLLAELPIAAEWVATRANDDDQRKVEWTRLRDVARQWSEHERDGLWNTDLYRNSWPEKPARLTDLERLLLALFVDAQRLKVALLSNESDSSNKPSSDDLLKLTNQATADRSDFWDAFRRALPRLGTADHPTPTLWREADRLVDQPWLSLDERRKLAQLRQLEPRGDASPNRSSEVASLWQGFWSIATLSLLSHDADGTANLWKDWERLVEVSQPTPGSANSTGIAEQDALRKRRAELGRSIRQQWSTLQTRAPSEKSLSTLPLCHLMAATLDPSLLPEADPDVRIRDTRQRQFADWMLVFAEDWRRRASTSSTAGPGGYAMLADRAETLNRELGGVDARVDPTSPIRLQEDKRPTFDATRMAQLHLSVPAGLLDKQTPLKVVMVGPRVRLVEGTRPIDLRQPTVRPLPAAGQLIVDLKLDDDVDTAQPLLVALTEQDGYPIDFRRILLYPPFDPSQWRIELVDAATGTALEHVPLSNVAGIKVFVPPMTTVMLRADLVRPAKDLTASAKMSILALTDAGKVPLIEDLNLKLTQGKERTAILCDLPAIPKEKDAPAVTPKDKPPAPLADLARGILFVITPEGQPPLEYHVHPTFWSASKFISEPQPVIRDDRLTLELERRQATSEDVLLPKKIPIELNLPDSLRRLVTDYTLGGPVAVGQKLTLSFALPKNWSDQTRDRNWSVALDVAGLPHTHRWRIEPTGVVTPIMGQPPQLNIRLLLPADDPKAPPRLEPVIRKGKEPLHLQFQVDATELDRSEETGDWTLSYKIIRETDAGNEATPLQHSWRLFSSIQRHVLLDNIQAGIWKMRTQAENYETNEAESEIRGLSGRFLVQATLTRSSAPSQPLASASFRFAIDDDAAPTLDIKGLTTDARSTNKDLALRVEALDLESGIQRLAYGFDKNGDKQLQEDEELIEEHTYVGIDNPKVTWPVIIPRSKIAPLTKDEETRNLIVQARNGLGTVATRIVPVTFKKAMLPKSLTTGTLVVTLSLSKGDVAKIQVDGPETRSEQGTKSESITFNELPPGKYEIKVSTNHPSTGIKKAGDAKIEVKVGQTTTANVLLLQSK